MSIATLAPRHAFPTGVTEGISHGTLELHDIPATRAFFREFLGLQTLRHVPAAFTTWRGEPSFFIACVGVGAQPRTQTRANRWELSVATAEEVQAAHQTALRLKDEHRIQQVDPLGEQDGFPWFCLQDLDGNWWGLSNRGAEWFYAAFDNKGIDV